MVTDYTVSYNDIELLSYDHGAGRFVGANHIESTWGAMKQHFRKLSGNVPTTHVQPFLDEWIARCNNLRLFASPKITEH